MPRRLISAGNPFLKSISTQILANVVRSILSSGQLQRNFPRPFPIASRDFPSQKCRGREGSLTQTGAVEMEAVDGSKSGVHGFMDSPALPQNHGPELETLNLSALESKIATKKPLAQGQATISPSTRGDQAEEIQDRRSARLGQKPLNLQTKEVLLNSEANSRASSGIWMDIAGASGMAAGKTEDSPRLEATSLKEGQTLR